MIKCSSCEKDLTAALKREPKPGEKFKCRKCAEKPGYRNGAEEFAQSMRLREILRGGNAQDVFAAIFGGGLGRK